MKKLACMLLISCLLWQSSWIYGHDHVAIARRNTPAIVQINMLDTEGSTLTATGFVISPTGLIVTTNHALNKALYTNVTFSNGATSGEAVILAQDPKFDLALLKIEAQHLPYVVLNTAEDILPGQTITVIGNPRRLQNTVTSGIISQLRRQKDGTIWHQISAPISPSSSGSPVFNEKGEVISVAFASIPGPGNQNLNFAMPAQYVKDLVQSNELALPPAISTYSQNPLLRHLQQSWNILKQLLHRWFKKEN